MSRTHAAVVAVVALELSALQEFGVLPPLTTMLCALLAAHFYVAYCKERGIG